MPGYSSTGRAHADTVRDLEWEEQDGELRTKHHVKRAGQDNTQRVLLSLVELLHKGAPAENAAALLPMGLALEKVVEPLLAFSSLGVSSVLNSKSTVEEAKSLVRYVEDVLPKQCTTCITMVTSALLALVETTLRALISWRPHGLARGVDEALAAAGFSHTLEARDEVAALLGALQGSVSKINVQYSFFVL